MGVLFINHMFNLENINNFFYYVFYFLMLNLFFMLCNIPLIFFMLFVGISKIFTYLPLFLVACIPLAPSFSVLLYCTGKIVRNTDLGVFRDIGKGVKLNVVQSFIMGLFHLFFTFILYINLSFFSKINLIVFCLFACIALVFLLITPYIYILMSRFSMKTLSILRVALILIFKKPFITITNIFVFAFALILFEISPGTTVVFISSIIAFLLSSLTKKIMDDLEENSTK